MPVYFSHLRTKLLQRTQALDKAFERHAVTPSTKRRIDRFALQEGLISSLWQAWCGFCREVVIGSAAGAETISGVATNSQYAGRSEAEIAFISSQFAANRTFTQIRAIGGNHLEPTWGDVNKLALIISGIAPSNDQALLKGFGAALVVKDLQMCRNASAHISKDALAKIGAARVRYLGTAFNHPSDIMHWIDASTNDYLWKSWIDEIELMSDLASQ